MYLRAVHGKVDNTSCRRWKRADMAVNHAGRADLHQFFPAPWIASVISWLNLASARLWAATKAA
jgi:hypothetical protein